MTQKDNVYTLKHRDGRKQVFYSSPYSADIKTEILQIIEAFDLGSFKGLLSFEPSSKVDGYIFTEFKTDKGEYSHYYRIK